MRQVSGRRWLTDPGVNRKPHFSDTTFDGQLNFLYGATISQNASRSIYLIDQRNAVNQVSRRSRYATGVRQCSAARRVSVPLSRDHLAPPVANSFFVASSILRRRPFAVVSELEGGRCDLPSALSTQMFVVKVRSNRQSTGLAENIVALLPSH